jgi:hypothetical protein
MNKLAEGEGGGQRHGDDFQLEYTKVGDLPPQYDTAQSRLSLGAACVVIAGCSSVCSYNTSVQELHGNLLCYSTSMRVRTSVVPQRMPCRVLVLPVWFGLRLHASPPVRVT